MSKPTPRPWKWWTSNSWRRLYGRDSERRDIPVAVPFNNRADGHPDIDITEADMAYIVKCVNLHDELVEALSDVVTQYPLIHPGIEPAWIRNARAILAKARATEEPTG